ncbi:MAG: arginine--tRNA ligase [Bacteroidales bacterium]|nr:arginine--tRNA ligase [Bacteroidales bacterium]
MIDLLLMQATLDAVKELYGQEVEEKVIQISKTRKDLEGDFTLVVFPLARVSRKSPMDTAEELGKYITEKLQPVSDYRVIKGFLNFIIDDSYFLDFYKNNVKDSDFGILTCEDQRPVVIEYSAPNTNKPLHLGHIRNNLLGYSMGELLKANGKNVKKVNLINDRGIHICKSMLAWAKWGEGATPESRSMKGDKLVGDFYVLFDQKYKEEIKQIMEQGKEEEEAKKSAPLILEAQEMLRKWEANDADVRALWTKMNQWVYDGFDVTYGRMGVDFDKVYHESETYLLGKEIVLEGLEKGILFKKEDGSVWADLTDEGLDQKLLLRGDGTSVYMTQDIGTAQLRFNDYAPNEMLYVVGNEQNYHFDVLKRVLIKLGKDWAEAIRHISYGMVELPEGKMKSREGTVVDADDLMDEMCATAKATTIELGKIEGFSEQEAEELFETIGQGALKYFILKVDPKKKMMFNPKESIDFNGNTGPFIQYTHARIQSIIRKANEIEGFDLEDALTAVPKDELLDKEKQLLKKISHYPDAVKQAGDAYSPALIANYVYDLVKEYNQFYHEITILKEEDEQKRNFRIGMSYFVASILKKGMAILGVKVPERM